MSSDLPAPWAQWRAARPIPRVVHLDSAAAGRSSVATLDATAAHARLEAEAGAYVAQEQAAEQIERARTNLAGLLGIPAAGLAFVGSASAGLAILLGCWPLPRDATIGVVRAEWGPNLEAFTGRGLRVVELDADATGALDLDALAQRLDAGPPTVVHLTHVTSHRALVQPVADAARLCHAAGTPLWVDAAQAVGHVDTDTGADAVYATSRKWLTGPRGIGMLGVAEPHWDALRVSRSAMSPPDLPPLAYLEPHEAHVPGRAGLAVAVAEYLDLGQQQVAARLDEVGALTRAALSDVGGWEVVGNGPGAITAIRPTAGQDVFATRARLLADHSVLTTAGEIARAPREVTGPLLRISPHVDCTETDLERLCDGLQNVRCQGFAVDLT